MLRIYEEQEISDLRLSGLYYDAFQICVIHVDQARASVFARRSWKARIVCEGPTSTEVEHLRKPESDSTSFDNFGVTKKWKSTITDVPRELGAEAFDRSLWR